jgi:hypothetical protein
MDDIEIDFDIDRRLFFKDKDTAHLNPYLPKKES